jgi:hypothetical protein
MRNAPTLLFVLLLTAACAAQRASPAQRSVAQGDPRWHGVDSLRERGLYRSALDLTALIGSDARARGDWRTEFRAWATRDGLHDMLGHAPDTLIRAMEARIAGAGVTEVPFHQLMHSCLAGQYWSAYQRDRWRVLERTNTAAGLDTSDMVTWDQRTYMRTVMHHLQASLGPADSLWSMPAAGLGELLGGDLATVAYRPTLYDLLAHRALALYANTETRLAEPAWHFTLEDPRAFALFEDFAFKTFRHRDSTSWEFRSLRLYQDLTRRHLYDAAPDALVDNDLARLRYVHARSANARKDTLLLLALELLRSRLPKDSSWAAVTVELAGWHRTQAARYDRLAGDAWKSERRIALTLCEEAIARFPKSTGAINARHMKAALLQPAVDLHAEQVVLPGRSFRVAADLMNVKQLWLRVIKGADVERWDKEGIKRLLKQQPLRAWTVTVPDDGDLNLHRVELPVDGLPPGEYTLFAANSAAFTYAQKIVATVTITVSQLAWTRRQVARGIELLVVDRATGMPAQGATVNMFAGSYDAGGRKWSPVMERTCDADGVAFFGPGEYGGEYRFTVKALGEERTTEEDHHYLESAPPAEEPRTFLFTDRAIYRPGQPIHFKGIVTQREGRAVNVLPGRPVLVRLYDVNGQQVDTLPMVTDAYGAFHGMFTAPLAALTGAMRIVEEHGSTAVRVEEYKRPTFEVLFDPVTAATKLGDEAVLGAVAKSYAGVPVDGAQVQWTVMRTARMPWWCGRGWYGLPGWGRSTEVASGTATTDAQGRFTIGFEAQADRSVPRMADPAFTFTVSATVTDINGESQPGTTALTLGYRAIDIDIALEDALDRSSTDSLGILLRNLNGQPVDLPMDVRIVRLQAPGLPLRPRLWERPDRFVLTAEAHAQRFSGEVYDREDDPLNWPAAATVVERKDWQAGGSSLQLEDVRYWPVGSYRIEVSAKDADGVPLSVHKVFTVYDPGVQNTGFRTAAFHAQGVKLRAEPGDKAVLLLGSALPEARVLMEVERDGRIAVRRWFTLADGQQRVELPVLEDDRGGFAVHLFCVERGRVHKVVLPIEVPWTSKELRVEWMSFRDKLLPGVQEEWRLRISGPRGEQVAAQLLTAMYDASLDAFVPHGWDLAVRDNRYPRRSWEEAPGFGERSGDRLWRRDDLPATFVQRHPFVKYMEQELALRHYGFMDAGADLLESRGAYDGWVARGHALRGAADEREESAVAPAKAAGTSQAPPPPVEQPLRTNFNETAFFLPDLLTDRDGSVVLRFTLPDALTRWKLLGLAHTTDLRTATFTRTAIAQKPLMVVPNLPRFLRAGDQITLTAKINALEQRIEGRATLALFDPFTNAPLDRAFGLKVMDQVFVAAPGESAVVQWTVMVPGNVDAVAVRVVARGGGGPMGGGTAADGEERVVPVLTDKLLVTESLPLAVSKAGTRAFTLAKLKRSGGSSSLQHKSLTLAFTPNPAWYAVQALPYLMEFPQECAEQVFSRYYANRLAAHIVDGRPAIRQVFEQWRSMAKTGGPDAFASALEDNTELKGMVLAETPWVLEALNDRQRKERIALLFDMQRMATGEAAAMKKLKDMQLPQGGWGWWSGMHPSRYITQHIVSGLGHLRQLGAATPVPGLEDMIKLAVGWLDAEAEREHRLRSRGGVVDSLSDISAEDIHYLYARSQFPEHVLHLRKGGAAQFIVERAQRNWTRYGLQEQAMIAIALRRLVPLSSTPELIMGSLRQRATSNEELGMYWPDFRAGHAWSSFPTETHALMIEAFHEVARDKDAVNALRQHLLALKRTTDWGTTKATADATYALLLTGDNWLEAKDAPMITVGGTRVDPANMEAGTGRFEQRWSGDAVRPAMGEVRVSTEQDVVQWGALHWQYLESMDKVTPHESPFSLRKQVMRAESTDDGTRLVALAGTRPLKVGDRLTIRIELRTDRYLDFVHLKDLRAAGLEPEEALSGYRYQGGLGYYQGIRDSGMDFFFDRIAPGTYVLEYVLRVTHAGDLSNGITTAMCMYAPEFSTHDQGVRLKVLAD